MYELIIYEEQNFPLFFAVYFWLDVAEAQFVQLPTAFNMLIILMNVNGTVISW